MKPENKIGIGIIGCGNISGIYCKNLQEVFHNVQLIACADQRAEAAQEKADTYKIRACTVDELLANPAVDIVLNLTTPGSHYEICNAALDAHKHVYVEKPLTIDLDEATMLVQKAKDRGLLIGCAPDTFLGAGIQTCRKLIDDGWIGSIVGATAFMVCHGHESWHPDPAFYYQKGGGPMFDMGPYYLTCLVSLMGPAQSVVGMTTSAYTERTITSAKRYGEKIKVETPTHVTGNIRFKNNAVASIITSFDIWHSQLPRIEIYGTEGSLIVPDPNTFGGPVLYRGRNDSAWHTIPLLFGYAENSRGIGVSDMADAIKTGKAHRASGDLALHVLEMMHGFHISSDQGREYSCQTPIYHSPRP
jgi:predicted dehydrogenase